MNNKKRALGQGLEQLFTNEMISINEIEEKIVESTKKEDIIEINLDELRSNPYQPRVVFDEEKLEELAKSIKEHGVFQPILAKKSIRGYEIIAGERRVRASKLAGNTTIPAIIKEFSDEDMMQIALLENLQRENLSAIEEAKAYEQLLTTLNITQDDLSRRVGKSRSHITNMLGLLKLPKVVQEDVLKQNITMGHARVLSKLEDNEAILDLVRKIKEENLSVRKLEELTSLGNYRKKEEQHRIKKEKNHDYDFAEELLEEKLGTKVMITKDKIKIDFANSKDLERILDILNIRE